MVLFFRDVLFPSDKDSEQVPFRQVVPLLPLKSDDIDKMKTIKVLRVEIGVRYRLCAKSRGSPCVHPVTFLLKLYIISPILHLKTLQLREVKSLVQVHIACKR